MTARDGTEVGDFSSAREVSEPQGKVQEDVDLARLVATQRAGGVGSFEIDMVTGERWWSGEFRRILGVAATQAASRELMLTRVHSGDRSRVEGVLQELDSGGRALDLGYRIVDALGRVRWVRSRTSFEFADDGSPRRILGTTMDVTALHLADARRRAAETKFHLGFDLSPVGLGMTDPEGRFQRVNSAVCQILGRSKEEILGKRLHGFLRNGVPARRSSSPAQPPRNGESGPAQIERQYLRPGGGVVWVQETMSDVPGVDGESAYSFVQLQDITSLKRAEQELVFQALHDPLTGLANRHQLTQVLERSFAAARESCGQVSVLFVDVDPFKNIDDGLGHAVGDRLIIHMARRLKALVRHTDTLARVGSHGFVIVGEAMTRESTERLAGRIVESSSEPFRIGGQELFVTVSVSFVLADGNEDAVTVLRNSDAARFRSKTHGRAQAMVFSKEMYRQASSRLDLESQLMRALDRDEFRVFYQPIVSTLTEDVVGFEALVRWEHSERGLISPMEFIPVAEETGLIIPIGEWVLRQALAQMRRWRGQVPGAESLSMSVNLSTLQLQDPGLVGMVADALAQTKSDPKFLHLEITESMVMEDIDTAVDTLNGLRSLGVNLSVDDFGTGHAALAYLIRLPVQTIKIDRSFVQALSKEPAKASSVVQSIVTLARALELDVIVEGIESGEQLEEVRRLGCRLAQGYLWSRPLPPEHIPGWLAVHPAAVGGVSIEDFGPGAWPGWVQDQTLDALTSGIDQMSVQGSAASSGAAHVTAAGRRRILRAFLIQALGYTSDNVLDELESLESSVSDAVVERIDHHLHASRRGSRAQARPVRPSMMRLTNARSGRELAIVRVSEAAPALLTHLAELGLAAQTRLTVRRHRSNSAVTTIQIRGHSREIHLGSVASDALWVESAIPV